MALAPLRLQEREEVSSVNKRPFANSHCSQPGPASRSHRPVPQASPPRELLKGVYFVALYETRPTATLRFLFHHCTALKLRCPGPLGLAPPRHVWASVRRHTPALPTQPRGERRVMRTGLSRPFSSGPTTSRSNAANTASILGTLIPFRPRENRLKTSRATPLRRDISPSDTSAARIRRRSSSLNDLFRLGVMQNSLSTTVTACQWPFYAKLPSVTIQRTPAEKKCFRQVLVRIQQDHAKSDTVTDRSFGAPFRQESVYRPGSH